MMMRVLGMIKKGMGKHINKMAESHSRFKKQKN